MAKTTKRRTGAPAIVLVPSYPSPWWETNPLYEKDPPKRLTRTHEVIDKVTGEVIATRKEVLIEIDGGSFADADILNHRKAKLAD